MPIPDYSSPNRFDQGLRAFGNTCHSFETSFVPTEKLGNVALPPLFAGIKKALLPSAIAIDVLRCETSFMSDGCCFGEHTAHTTADILGELAGGFAASAAGLSGGEAIGAGLGSVIGGPLGAVTGGTVGGLVGSLAASVGGSYGGACLSEQIARGLGVFGFLARHAESLLSFRMPSKPARRPTSAAVVVCSHSHSVFASPALARARKRRAC